MTSAAFLSRQSDLASSALLNTVTRLKQDVARAAHIGPWAAYRPWTLVSTAAVAGFTVAAATIRKRDRRGANAVGKPGPEMDVGTCGAEEIRFVEPRRSPSWLWTWTRGTILGIARMAAMRAIGMILTGGDALQPFAQSAPDRADDGSSIDQ
jgi:hypothetical protein